ncbi:hypothetical protein [Pseudonocardia sp. D17]
MTWGLAWWYAAVSAVIVWCALAVGMLAALAIKAARWVRRRW